jgi:serine/threonine-protein kinase SRPK3
MLRLHPDKRAKASELIHHNWLDGIAVQGEIDVIRRAEDDEMQKGMSTGVVDGAIVASGIKPGAFGHGADGRKHQRKVSVLEQSEADAMKPVDDIVALSGDVDKPSPPSHGHNASHAPPTLSAAPVPLSAAAKENARQGTGSIAVGAVPVPPRSSSDGLRLSTGKNSSKRRS